QVPRDRRRSEDSDLARGRVEVGHEQDRAPHRSWQTRGSLDHDHDRPTLRLRAAVAYSRLIEWVLRHHRAARLMFAVSDIRARITSKFLRGEGCECSCCGGHFRRMRDSRLTGWKAICPRCGAFSRQRAISLLLPKLDLPGPRVLHFAPEQCFDPVFERLPQLQRLTTDLHAPSDLRLDLTDIDLPDDSFDLVICSHVLE